MHEMTDKLHGLKERYHRLEDQLSDPSIISDNKKFSSIHKQYKDLKQIIETFNEYLLVVSNMESAKQMSEGEIDPEMKEMALEELNMLTEQEHELSEKIKFMLIPKDMEDEKDVIFEIRSGTGGDEASIFAGDLYRMYSKYFENQKWKVELIYVNEGTVGGYNKIVMEIKGDDVFGKLKFESGAHRVQRVPKTESQGRVHTSAATVAVMPKFEMEDVEINKTDLKIDTYRSSGAGGQHVNKTESAVRITHLPTGVVSESQDSRNQLRNREIALQRLYAKIFEAKQQAHDDDVASKRRSLVGSGDRSGKIRTYNYSQNRVTDHRINLTLYSLDKIIAGDIDQIIEALQIAENTEKLNAGMSI